jgi:hypothetical protein
VGYKLLHVRLSPPALKKDNPLVYVDLGGIAKGYAAQAVGDALESHGVRDYLVAVGGELRAHGLSSSGHPWRVGIETPTPDVRRIFYSLELKNASLSTSGDYRNFFEINGTRYCHEINPKTGRPIPAGLASVSIVHPSGTYADAMATALMVLGPQEGMDFARGRGLAVFFIMRQSDHFETLSTPEFDQLGGAVLNVPVNGTDGSVKPLPITPTVLARWVIDGRDNGDSRVFEIIPQMHSHRASTAGVRMTEIVSDARQHLQNCHARIPHRVCSRATNHARGTAPLA